MTTRNRNTTRPLPHHKGDVSLVQDSVSIASYQGHRPYQEDRFLVQSGFDGTGAKAFLAAAFQNAADATEDMTEGSTGTGVVLTKDLQLTAAFLGDSPVVVFVRDPKTSKIVAFQLSRDHHPDLPDEKIRIKAEGGVINSENRLSGLWKDGYVHTLAVSRAFGDEAMSGLSRQPEFASADLKKEIDAGKEVYILVSSDGLFEGSQPHHYMEPLRKAIADKKENSLAEIFALHAHARGSKDNMTALVFKVPKTMKEGLFLAIADGHGGVATSDKVIQSFATDAKAKLIPPSPST